MHPNLLNAFAAGLLSLALSNLAAKEEPAPVKAIAALEVERYMGRWYQVALYPNRFQAQCVSDTTAEYRLQNDGSVTVINRCRTSQGAFDEATGLANAAGTVDNGALKPAQLKVSFLPSWLRWTGIGRGDYWVIHLPSDYRYSVVSEPERRFLWILSRTPELTAADKAEVTQVLQSFGFDLSRLQPHAHSTAK
ncbi:MAG TPA: lipocalin family protein [Rubrivivax sp.]|nr:lipocalin family protein [Rubrivivax sp.]